MDYNQSLFYLWKGVLVEKSNRPADPKMLNALMAVLRTQEGKRDETQTATSG